MMACKPITAIVGAILEKNFRKFQEAVTNKLSLM